MKKQIVIVIIIILWGTKTHAQTPYPFDGKTTSAINRHYLYLCDSSNRLTSIQALERFNDYKGISWVKQGPFNVGIKPYIYWFRLPILNPTTNEQDCIFRISTSLAYYQIFSIDSSKTITRVFDGNSATPYNKRPFKHRDIAVPIHLKAGETKFILFSVDKRNRGLYMPLYLNSVEQALRMELDRHWVYAWHFGIYLFIALFNIFLFLTLRDKVHIWYTCYIISAILFMFEDEKFYVEYLPDFLLRFCESVGTFPFSLIIIGTGLKIMQLLLGQTKENSRLYNFIKIEFYTCIILAFVLFAVAVFSTDFNFELIARLHNAVDILVGIGLLLILASSIEKIVQKNVLAIYYFFATLLPLFGAAIFYLNHFGITNINPIQPNAIVAGITTEIIALSFLLVIRYNNFKKDKLKLLEKLNEQEKEILFRILTTQEDERKRIALDLHDDLGGTLTALKLHISRKNEIKKNIIEADFDYHQHSLTLISKASEDLRNIAHNLLPKDFLETGLFKTLENTINLNRRSTSIYFNLITEGDSEKIDEIKSIIIYRIMNEIITNIVKHSQASEATLQVLVFDNTIQLIADDNGIGIKKNQNSNGIGIKNIETRVAFLRGTILVESNKQGTTTIINLPINNK